MQKLIHYYYRDMISSGLTPKLAIEQLARQYDMPIYSIYTILLKG